MMDSSSVLSIGDRVFGGYVVSDKLGEGGMGVVYAITNEALNRKLALKLLLPQWSRTPQIVQRFLAEARAASAIRHPNIIEILDASQFDDGSHYMLMEYLDGDSLEKFLRERGPVSVETALEILAQVCSGLQAAHDRGIIHRDLKPANLFICPTPTTPLYVKILDFGIAKLSDPTLAGDLRTMTNTVIGTPAYMSPEQARGAKDLDHRTDIYALAVISYELLAGTLPYAASSLADLVYLQATAPPRDLSELRGDLPSGWHHTIMSALSANPNDRPQTAKQFIDQLIASSPGRQTQTVWLAPPAQNKRRRRLAPVVVAALVAFSGAALGFRERRAQQAFPEPVATQAPAPLHQPKPPLAAADEQPTPIIYRLVPMPEQQTYAPRHRKRRHRPHINVSRRRKPVTEPKRPKLPTSKPTPVRKFDPNAPAG